MTVQRNSTMVARKQRLGKLKDSEQDIAAKDIASFLYSRPLLLLLFTSQWCGHLKRHEMVNPLTRLEPSWCTPLWSTLPDSSPSKRVGNQDWPWQSVFPHPSLGRAVEKTNVYITELNCWSILIMLLVTVLFYQCKNYSTDSTPSLI